MTKSNQKIGVLVCGLGCILAWAYWSTFRDVAERWSSNPIYSHGYLVPFFAGFLLWYRRKMLDGELFAPSWRGLPWIIVGASLHTFGAYLFVDWLSAVSILPIMMGLVLSFGGWNLFRWSWPAIAFLAFMLPLPYSVEVGLAHPLQRLATLGSTYALQTIGFAAFAEGNNIFMEGLPLPLRVAEACNGLGMLVVFFALSTAVAMLTRGRLTDKAVILLSAIPIALLANVIRITATGILTEIVGATILGLDVHDFLGYFMVPLGLSMLMIEKLILDKLLVEQAENEESFCFADVSSVKQSCPV